MKIFIAALLFAVALTPSRGADALIGREVILPNSKLLKTCASACSPLWLDKPTTAEPIYPASLTVDNFESGGNCPHGVMAFYDKSVSFDEIKVALDQRWGKWAVLDHSNPRILLWRVESERFAIQLAITGKETNEFEPGTKQLIYIAFSGSKCQCQ